MLDHSVKIETPEKGRNASRKLYIVPLIFAPNQPQPELARVISWYWEQIEAQLADLETTQTKANKVYHELITIGGEEGEKAIAGLNKGSYQIAKTRLDNGAELYPIEAADLLLEFIDWTKCLAIEFQSRTALNRVSESYTDVQKRRNEYIARQIDRSLKAGEAGILIFREGHQIQFPADMQLFYITPPDLDELKHWYKEQKAGTGQH